MRLIRLRQAGIVLVGLVLAAVMVVLGLWQLDVYHSQGQAVAEQRAGAPPSEVGAVARAGQPVPDGYGRTVLFRGRYLPGTEVLVPEEDQPGRYRVVTALRLDNGDVLPVVRGTATSTTAPPAPSGDQAGQGLLLPSEEAPTGDLPEGQISSVRLPTLAQTWPAPIVSGFVTLQRRRVHRPGARAGRGGAARGQRPAAQRRLRRSSGGSSPPSPWAWPSGWPVTRSWAAPRLADLTPEEPARAT